MTRIQNCDLGAFASLPATGFLSLLRLREMYVCMSLQGIGSFCPIANLIIIHRIILKLNMIAVCMIVVESLLVQELYGFLYSRSVSGSLSVDQPPVSDS